MAEQLVIDASAMVDYLVGSPLAVSIADRIEHSEVHVPAHFDAEVVSALGRLHRAEHLTGEEVEERLRLTADAPFHRHLLAPLLEGAWRLRHNLRLVDALYIELARQVEATIVSTDSAMASASSNAELVGDHQQS